MMKILHTSDWHLGQRFLYSDRQEEHERALDWLLNEIETQGVDLLIVSGDIFDIGNPPNYARRQYFLFLTQLLASGCRHVVIVGGNHDSPTMLNAPKELLQALQIHVVGAAPPPEEALIELRDRSGKLEAVVGAAPFLRDGDLHYSIAGEGGLERIERLREGIRDYYEAMGQAAAAYREAGVPVLATGHLYATGAEASARQDNIYIGNVENIEAEQFPTVFDYVALGHIHRPQAVGGRAEVRYSGSLIPLSFSETKDDKKVVLITFDGRRLTEIREVAVPTFRRLKTIQGSLAEVEAGLKRFAARGQRELTPWVEVIVETDQPIPQLDVRLRDLTAEMDLELVKIRLLRDHRSLDAQTQEEDLNDLAALDVFRKKCNSYGSSPEEEEALVHTFRELQAWLAEKEADDS